ncbi:MAG TPA: hypothetical protein PLI98_10525, partial [Candidatus Hydrogenedentes bacterium]|nr:hypothetical protein [Candidatus Hydrogenedentota bacterium]
LPIVIALFAVFSEYSGLDRALCTPFYDPVTGTWPLKSNFWTAGVLHNGGKDMVVYVMVGVLALFLLSFLVKRVRPYRKGAGYVLAGSLLGPAIVGILKSTTRIYTPWDLTLFGGTSRTCAFLTPRRRGFPWAMPFPEAIPRAGLPSSPCIFFCRITAPNGGIMVLRSDWSSGGCLPPPRRSGERIFSAMTFSLWSSAGTPPWRWTG